MASVHQQHMMPALQDRRTSPNPPLVLKSNNPFRRAASPPSQTSPPALQSPVNLLSVQDVAAQKRVSTNPFLDDYKTDTVNYGGSFAESPRRRPAAERETIDLFGDLSVLEDKPAPGHMKSAHRSGTHPTPTHRPRASDDARRDEVRRNRLPSDSKPTRSKDPFNALASDLEKIEIRRSKPRRNSESSVIDLKDDEARKRERRRREARTDSAKAGTRDGDARPSRSKRPDKKIDLIDKLDLTGIYGSATFHHDGPFDACNPHRNRKGSRRAPMQAFPVDSQNNAMGGSGPIHKEINFDRYHGRGDEGWSDFNAASKIRRPPPPAPAPAPAPTSAYAPAAGQRRDQTEPSRPLQYGHAHGNSDLAPGFNTLQTMELLHGDETAGLGTSTFLEGTPVSRSALQRRESESETTVGPGLARKKSLAQKLRGISRPRQFGPDGRVLSPDGFPSPQSPEYVGVQSAGGRGRMLVEKNPFFAEAGRTEKPKMTTSEAPLTRARTTSSPGRGRSSPEQSDGRAGTGILDRVRSIKGRSKRPERSQG